MDYRYLGVAVLVLAVLSVVGVFYAQGSFFEEPSSCDFQTVTEENSSTQYSSQEAFLSDFQEVNGYNSSQMQRFKDSVEFRVSDVDGDGEPELQRRPEDCVEGFGGGAV